MLHKQYFPSVQSSGNVMITNNGSSTNNKNNINVQINNANNSPIIKEINDQNDVIPALIEDEITCLPLETEPLYLEFLSDVQIIPNLTCKYQTVILDGYKCKSLEDPMRLMLRQSSQTLIDLKLFDCEFDVMTLCDILRELPLLQSLELSMKLTHCPLSTVLAGAELPKLLYLKDIKVEINVEIVKNTYLNTSN